MQKEDTVGIWAENWPLVAAFSRVLSQWRTVALPTGRIYFTSLDYTAVATVLAGYRIEQTPELWDGIRIMEPEARAVLNAD